MSSAMLRRWKATTLVYAVLLLIVGTAFFRELCKDNSFNPSTLNENIVATDADDTAAAEDESDFWEWETTTRFSARKKDLKEDDQICDSFPSHMLSQVQVILKIGAS